MIVTDLDRLFSEPRFRHPQVEQICRVDRHNLLDWHRRGLVSEARTAKGRGHRRLYSIRDVIHINTVRIFSDSGLPLSEADRLVPAIAEYFDLHWRRQRFPDVCVVASCSSDGDKRLWVFEPVKREHLFKKCVECTIVLDVSFIAFSLRWRIAEEMAKRTK